MELSTTVAPTTTLPKGASCNAVCTLGGQPATCTARILWSKEHVFKKGAPKQACFQAHKMVLGQCDMCAACTLADTKCQDPEPPATEVDGQFDCLTGVVSTWSGAKKVWCCVHTNKGCSAQADAEGHMVFKQKFDAESVARLQGNDGTGRNSRSIGFLGFGLAAFCAALLVVRRATPGESRETSYRGMPDSSSSCAWPLTEE